MRIFLCKDMRMMDEKNKEIGRRLKEARSKAGFGTAREAAEALGIKYPTYAGHENGSRGLTQSLETYAKRFKVSLDWLLTGNGNQVETPKPNAAILGSITFDNKKTMPVYGQAVAGVDGEFVLNGNILYEIICPPQLCDIKNAYGVVVSGSSMEPRYFDGETVYINPMRRVRSGDFVVAQVQMDEFSLPHAFVKRLVRHNSQELVLEQYNPPKELVFPHDHVVSVHYIAMAGEAE